MLQTWSTFTALHWRYDGEVVQPHLPDGLTVDTHDGTAWVSITPFLMTHVRLPGLPAVPGLSTFPETNLRTYVSDDHGRQGMWFFTLEASSLAFVAFARATLGAPYNRASMSVEHGDAVVRYRSTRRSAAGEACTTITVVPSEPVAPADLTPLDDFLTGRWRGYVPTVLGLGFVPVEHQPWPLRQATVEELDETLFTSCGLPGPHGDPMVHYAHGVDVRFGRPELVRADPRR